MPQVSAQTYSVAAQRVRDGEASVRELACLDWTNCPNLEPWLAKAILELAVRSGRPPEPIPADDEQANLLWNRDREALIAAMASTGKISFPEERTLALERAGDWVGVLAEKSVHHEWVPFLIRRKLHVHNLSKRADLTEEEASALWTFEEARSTLCRNPNLPPRMVAHIIQTGLPPQVLTVISHVQRQDAWVPIRMHAMKLLREKPRDGHTAIVVGKILSNPSIRLDHKTALLNGYTDAIGGRPMLELMQKSQAEVFRPIQSWMSGKQGLAFEHGGGLQRFGMVLAH